MAMSIFLRAFQLPARHFHAQGSSCHSSLSIEQGSTTYPKYLALSPSNPNLCSQIVLSPLLQASWSTQGLKLANVTDPIWNALLLLSTYPNFTFLQSLLQTPVPNNSIYLYHAFIAFNFYLSSLV